MRRFNAQVMIKFTEAMRLREAAVRISTYLRDRDAEDPILMANQQLTVACQFALPEGTPVDQAWEMLMTHFGLSPANGIWLVGIEEIEPVDLARH